MMSFRYYEPARTLAEINLMDQLIAIRRHRGLTGCDVAAAMDCSQPAIAQIETSARRGHTITLERLLRYAGAVGAEIRITESGPR
jgi:transcriptional regulator with XRE-family HTH domain